MLDFTPSSIALQIGPISIFWYGIGYAAGLVLAGWVIAREARRRGLAVDEIPNGMIVIAIAAVIGGRLYHVIDQWQLYKDDIIKVVLPPYTGLGAYGGIILGTIVGVIYIRRKRQSVLDWADAIAPGLFAMQAVARWGNFFNQELYGPPTNLPWGIPIECAKRVSEFACPPVGTYAFETTRFQPLFLYESLSGLIGMLALMWLARRFSSRLRQGDLLLGFFIWYGTVRFALESLRTNNWTFFSIPTAQIVSAAFVLGALAVLAWRHRPGSGATGVDATGVDATGADPTSEPADGAVEAVGELGLNPPPAE